MKTLALTVLAYEGPSVRAYLATMRRAGFRPARILLTVLSHHPLNARPVGRWLPRGMRMWYAEKGQQHALNFWPRRIKAAHPHLVDAMVRSMASLVDDPASLIDEMVGRFRYEDYADQVERVLIKDLRDPALPEAVAHTPPGAVLFTGGGILPPAVIDLPGFRFLHVHPGHLPFVRGADGLLWSTLVRGQPAMSCFYLARGIDTGGIIAVEDYPSLQFDLGDQPRPDDRTLYRAIFSFCDPLLRADLLVRRVLNMNADLSALPVTTQDESRGVTYHFMHASLREKVFQHLFIGSAKRQEHR